MLRTSVKIVAVLVMLTLGAGSAWAAQAAKVDVTGKWTLTVQSDAGTSMPTATFKQEGEKLTGHYSSMLVGEAELTGSVKGQAIEFTVLGEVQGTQIQLKFEGTLDGKDSMKGKLVIAGLGEGTFTAKRN
jgi:hypothetical protein